MNRIILTTLALMVAVWLLCCDLLHAQITVTDQFKATIDANQKVLDALKAANDDGLADVVAALEASIQSQNELLKSLSQFQQNGKTIRVMHPQVGLPVTTRHVAAWYRPGHSGQLLVSQTWFKDGVYPEWPTVEVWGHTTPPQPPRERQQPQQPQATPQVIIPLGKAESKEHPNKVRRAMLASVAGG